MWHYGFGWGFFPFFPFVWVIFWILIVTFFFRRWRKGDRSWYSEKSAEEILRERFARGEINEKEFKERMKVLKENTK